MKRHSMIHKEGKLTEKDKKICGLSKEEVDRGRERERAWAESVSKLQLLKAEEQEVNGEA